MPRNDFDINGVLHLYKNIKVKANCSNTRENVENRIFDCNAPINISSGDIWYSNEYKLGQTYTVSFIDTIIYLSHYSIQVSNDGAFPQSWIIEGKGYNDNWELISNVSNSGINTNYQIKTYSVDKRNPYQHFRMTNTGLNIAASPSFRGALYLYKIDFFGAIETLLQQTVKCYHHSFYHYFIIFILIS